MSSLLSKESLEIAEKWLTYYDCEKQMSLSSNVSKESYLEAEDKLFKICRQKPETALNILLYMIEQTNSEYILQIIFTAPLGYLIDENFEVINENIYEVMNSNEKFLALFSENYPSYVNRLHST